MNLFNFLRFSSIEKKAKDDSVLFRVAKKRNGNYVLVNDKGTIVSKEFDWISEQVADIRLAENNGILVYIKNDNNQAKDTTMPRVTSATEKAPEVYAGADENGLTQVYLNGETKGTFMVNDHNFSKLFKRLTAPNKNGLRIGWLDNHAEILSTDARRAHKRYGSIAEPDSNGVRYAVEESYSPAERADLMENGIYIPEIPRVSLIPVNFTENIPFYKSAKPYESENYIVVLENNKQALLNKNGNNIAGGMYHNISAPNALGEVIATRSKVKSNGSVVLVHEGKHFTKANDLHKVIDSAPIGIKAMKYGRDLNKNVVAGVNISEGIEIDEDVNRVLISLLKGEKPMPRFWKSIEANDKFNLLFEGVTAYQEKLDEIAKARPELANEVILKKQNLTKSLSTLMKRKVAGHKTYEMREDKKIDEKKSQIAGHEKNIKNSSNVREKLNDAMNNFQK